MDSCWHWTNDHSQKSVSVPNSPAQISHGLASAAMGLRQTAGAMALPEIFDVPLPPMSINNYECHNILLSRVAFETDTVITFPLCPKDKSVNLGSALPSSGLKYCAVKTWEVFVFVSFHLVIRTDNHIFLILLYGFSALRCQWQVQRSSLKNTYFFPRKMESNRCKVDVKICK